MCFNCPLAAVRGRGQRLCPSTPKYASVLGHGRACARARACKYSQVGQGAHEYVAQLPTMAFQRGVLSWVEEPYARSYPVIPSCAFFAVAVSRHSVISGIVNG